MDQAGVAPELAERRAFLAFAVSLHLLKAETVLRVANSVGRGI